MRAVTRTVLGLGLAGAGVLGWASLIERNAFVLRRFEVPVLPAGADPLRVLHLSDMHLLPRQRAKSTWIHSLASLDPDLVVNTGDNLAGPDAVPAVLDTFELLLDRPGVFVLGSNDYFSPKVKNPFRYLTRNHAEGLGTSNRLPTADLIRGLGSRGWVDLSNRRDTLTVRGLRLDFVGVDDPHLGYDRLDLVRGSASPEADLTIGVTHAPYQRVLDAFADDGAALLIAGHTHGGQVCVPRYGALVTNCDLDTSRAKGLSRWWPGAGHRPSSEAPEGAAWLEVSAGLGTSPTAPVRLACRPEATLLTLVPRD
ncbi:metallophosphoesterase [Intrasporangium oryzae NRRL B-24470]|uniref:Metallophosphoesterase n=1 Tax=Intrasporangium oryzae NRRL B-24470 TaxID=1386089 RepID=W9G4G0_9MICO|nr:metallophosphoesterase [Intrasporangium oryzae]EWT00197.1 metallophosphoesterase [Intrasporangium oryzae NRRL B-24470]